MQEPCTDRFLFVITHVLMRVSWPKACALTIGLGLWSWLREENDQKWKTWQICYHDVCWFYVLVDDSSLMNVLHRHSYVECYELGIISFKLRQQVKYKDTEIKNYELKELFWRESKFTLQLTTLHCIEVSYLQCYPMNSYKKKCEGYTLLYICRTRKGHYFAK